tara:strand:- start:281 stop:937 length:657 start_codon:yes stop_codon:yes gene_type:complete
MNEQHKPVWVPISKLKAHPRNYRGHPDYQLSHIMQSIKEHGFYRNVVTANDGTILAGHGVVEASKRLDMKKVLSVRLDIEPDSPAALKVMTGDNAISGLSQDSTDDLLALLEELHETNDLLGTGYDEQMLSDLLMAAGQATGLDEIDAYAEWEGMPSYEHEDQTPVRQIIVSFKDDAAVQEFAQITGNVQITDKTKSVWYPRLLNTSAVDRVFSSEDE